LKPEEALGILASVTSDGRVRGCQNIIRISPMISALSQAKDDDSRVEQGKLTDTENARLVIIPGGRDDCSCAAAQSADVLWGSI
jgi:hypothetical protein